MVSSDGIPQLPGRRVVCSAIRHPDGWIICSARHFDPIMRDQVAMMDYTRTTNDWQNPDQQGFIDQWGQFMTRTEAWKVAENAGQILRRVGGDTIDGGTLFSENLY